jgi:hypothetical protein
LGPLTLLQAPQPKVAACAVCAMANGIATATAAQTQAIMCRELRFITDSRIKNTFL